MSDQDLVFWVWFLLALMPIFAATGWLIGGIRRHRSPKPLPGLWWLCPACRSVNAPDRPTCYACGAPLPADPLTLPTAPDFSIVQRFGPSRPVEEVGGRPATAAQTRARTPAQGPARTPAPGPMSASRDATNLERTARPHVAPPGPPPGSDPPGSP